MKSLIGNLQNSIYDPAFCQEILLKPFSFSLRYFFLFSLTCSLAFLLILSLLHGASVYKFFTNIGQNVVSFYPQELIVIIKDGKVSTNVSEPYRIKMPNEWQTKDSAKNFLVIDTKHPFTLEEFNAYGTQILLTKDALIMHSDNSQIRIDSLNGIPDATIDRSFVYALANKVQPFLTILPFALLPLGFIGLFLLYIVNLLYLLIAALLIWTIARLKKLPFGYKKSYQLGLHAITLPLILYSIAFFFFPAINFPFVFTILLLAIVWINLNAQKQEVS